jgi:hypothetical protein
MLRSILPIALLTLTLSSCNKSKTQNNIQDAIQQGTWLVSNYMDNGSDETMDFNTFRFTFNQDGSLQVMDLLSSSTNQFMGQWSITDSNSNDDSINDLDFNITLNAGNKLDDLTDDWDIISQSETEIKLMDVSGGNGGTDYVTFSKI